MRTLCHLTHRGHAQYCKGDGDLFNDFLGTHYAHLSNECVGRAETSKRQDWSLEVSSDLFSLIEPLLHYTTETLIQNENILRDTALMRLECIHFQCYVHVCAAMWRVAWRELRGLTNAKGLEINPLELNALYEELWTMGELLQSDNCLSVMEDDYRPWKKQREGDPRSVRFYERLEADKVAEVRALREYHKRGDVAKYSLKVQPLAPCCFVFLVYSSAFFFLFLRRLRIHIQKTILCNFCFVFF